MKRKLLIRLRFFYPITCDIFAFYKSRVYSQPKGIYDVCAIKKQAQR